jgi:hypothetical protein
MEIRCSRRQVLIFFIWLEGYQTSYQMPLKSSDQDNVTPEETAYVRNYKFAIVIILLINVPSTFYYVSQKVYENHSFYNIVRADGEFVSLNLSWKGHFHDSKHIGQEQR